MRSLFCSIPPTSSLRRRWAAAIATLTLLVASGCGPGNPPPGYGEEDHFDILIGSTEDGSGQLVLDFPDNSEVPLVFSQCIGGDGEDCLGGIALYGAEDPGFQGLTIAEPDEPLYPLPDGTLLQLTLVSRDEGASLFVEGESLDQPGDSVAVPSPPELHFHGAWQVAVPGGTPVGSGFKIVLQLIATTPGFSHSQELTLVLKPGSAGT